MRSAARYGANEANGVSAYQRAGSVPGGHQRYVGFTPVAGGVDYVEADTGLCGAPTRSGDPCKNKSGDCRHHRGV